MSEDLRGIFADLIHRIDGTGLEDTGVVRSWSPVPYFGDLSSAVVATVGLNPSDKEFEDDHGREIRGAGRRFHTLDSLGIASLTGRER